MENQPADKSAASDAQARRVLALKRAFQRDLGRKPTTLQRTLIDHASVLTARAEVSAADAACAPNDVVRLSNIATRARQAMFEAFAASKPRELTLGDILAEAAATPTSMLVAGARR